MTHDRLREAADGGGTWWQMADAAAEAAGPFPSSLVTAWRVELDAVEARVRLLERAAPESSTPFAGDGVHALLALAGARLGTDWPTSQLIAAASAVELAHRATRHHSAVADAGVDARQINTRHVLDGDWSITEAAMLVSDIGAAAYRLLVRGYGAAQLARLELGEHAAAVAMFPTAVALGALVAHVDDLEFPLAAGSCAASDVLRWACSLPWSDGPLKQLAAR